nr:EOG090X0DYO [Chydorus sphaericus]
MAALVKTFQCLRFSFNNSLKISAGANVIAKRNYKPKWVAPTLKDLKTRKDIENCRNGGEKIFHRSTFLEWNYDAELYAFGNRLNEKFEDALLRQALTHKSYVLRETERLQTIGVEPNLEFKLNDELAKKGAEMISRFVRGYLRAVFTKVPEEMISVLHNYLTSTEVLTDVAKHIGLGDIMLCADFPPLPETFVKSLQAIIAALEESSGEEKARIFVQDLIITQLYGKDVNELWNPLNPAGILASILEREGKAEPEFRLIRHAGSKTILAVYHVAVYCDKVYIAEGSGESLEIAQEMAAREALKKFFETEDSMKALPFGRQLKAVQSKVVKLEHRPNVPLNEWSLAKVSSLAH